MNALTAVRESSGARRVASAWPLAQRFWFDAAVVTVLVASVVDSVYQYEEHRSDVQGPLWFDVLASVGTIAPLLFRRRYPFGAPVVVVVAVVVSSFVDPDWLNANGITFFVAIAVAALFGMLPNRRWAVAGISSMVVAVGLVAHNQGDHLGDFLFPAIVFGIAWGVGYGLDWKVREVEEAKERAERAERARDEEARAAVAEERARIARELHDIVGHSVSVMTVQAAGVRSLLRPDQERARDAVAVVEQTGREALAEMRRLVGVLRRPEESPALAPQPSLEHVDKLVEQAREAGLPVELRVEGEPVELSAGLDLTAYRFVQEGLTNATKHARAKHAEVLVRYIDGRVELTVTDDGTGDGGGESGGHGLVGMRERVSVYGGELDAGPRPEGGYRLHASLPVG